MSSTQLGGKKTLNQCFLKYINEQIAYAPFDFGENLKGNLQGLHRYRVGDYRIICEIQEHIITVLVVSIGHRRDVYKTVLKSF